MIFQSFKDHSRALFEHLMRVKAGREPTEFEFRAFMLKYDQVVDNELYKYHLRMQERILEYIEEEVLDEQDPSV